MVFAPKKVANDIGWGSRRNISKSCKEISQKKAENHGLKSEKASSKRERKSDEEFVSSSVLGANIKRAKDEKDSETKNDFFFHSSPFKGRVLPDVELETKCEKNIFSSTITMETPTAFAFVGRAKVIALEGCVEVLGYHLQNINSSDRRQIIIECPSWMNSLTISSASSNKSISINAKKKYYAKIEFVSMDSNTFSYRFMNLDEARSRIIIDERWINAANDIYNTIMNQNIQKEQGNSMNRTLICGAKNVGKSTFAKFLCNRLLSMANVDRIAYLECDVGQPELSPPGILSLTILTKPLLCSPHVHMVCHDGETKNCTHSYGVANQFLSAYYYGSTSSKVNPLSFSQAVHQLMNDYTTFCQTETMNVPLIVNTDGWVKGMGYEMLSSTIETVQPDSVIQIIGSTKAKFFDITQHAMPNRKIYVLFSPSSSRKPEEAIELNTATDHSLENNAISPSLLRNLRLCTYFLGGYEKFYQTGALVQKNGIIDDNCKIALALSRQKPYVVPFDAVTCTILNDGGNNKIFSLSEDIEYPDYLYDILNGSVVGLCSGSKDCSNINEINTINGCVGLGIVRSINRSTRLYYILTPVPVTTLKSQVTNIVLGQVQLPFECVFLGHSSSAFPYQSCDMAIGGEEKVKANGSFSL